MANALLLKRRIRTAQNVAKTTRAMQMIAASKLKKAQLAAIAARPYVEKLTSLSLAISSKIEEKLFHPYMRQDQTIDKTLLIVISPDRGLCGGLITNLVREYLNYQKNKNFAVITIGKRLERVVSKSGNELIASFPLGASLPRFELVYGVAKLVDELFLSSQVQAVKILSTRFQSIFIQKPAFIPLLPLSKPLEHESTEQKNYLQFQLFEPKISDILPDLLKRYLHMVLYQQILEGFLSEQAARMLAMQNATDNAKDIIEELTLQYNKARQAKITGEILDIISASAFAYE